MGTNNPLDTRPGGINHDENHTDDSTSAKKHKSSDESTQNSTLSASKTNDNGMIPNFFNATDEGPFRVHIEYIDSPSTKDREIQRLMVAQTLQTKLKLTGITDVKKFGRKTVTVYFNDFNLANDLVSKKTELEKFLFKAYIPNSYLYVTGVLRNVDQEFDLDDFQSELQLTHPVVKVERMTRFDRDTNTRINTNSVRIMFRASKLPNEIIAYHTKIHVSPFVGRVKQCNKCCRYGHYAEQCKSKVKKCCRCGQEDHPDKVACVQKCLYCKKEHDSTSSACEEKQRQKNIKYLMAKNNISYFEAMEQFPTYTSNTYAVLENIEEFPVLERKSYSNVTKGSRTRTTPTTKSNPTTPRNRLAVSEKFRKTAQLKRQQQSERRNLPTAEQQTNPLAGPSFNFVNIHKTTLVEKIADDFKKMEEIALNNIKSGKLDNNNPIFLFNNTSNSQTSKQNTSWNEDESMEEELKVD